MRLRNIIGSGDKIMLFTLPFLAIGLVLNILFPSVFSVDGPSVFLTILCILFLVPGLLIWIWSIALILTKVPKNELITTGPYSLVKHPLYASVSFLVLPWLGFLLNSWLGLLIGIILYLNSRKFSPKEEEILSKNFGPSWDSYVEKVKLPWL